MRELCEYRNRVDNNHFMLSVFSERRKNPVWWPDGPMRNFFPIPNLISRGEWYTMRRGPILPNQSSMIRRLLACACIFLLAAAHCSSAVFAAMSVSASVESGAYDRVFEVKLVPSDPAAKLFYTFEPDGSPMDAYAYTGAIRVAASTPLLYFAFTDPANESPIYRQDYELRYSTGVLLSVSPDDRIFSLSRPAAESGSIALDSWTLRKDGRTLHEFAATDFLPA
jgi:hypothetical protein